jgi:nitrate reductase gamma subunit
MSGSTLLALAYVLLAVFIVATVLRSVRIARLPVHLRWELAPVPKEKTRSRYGGSYLEEYEWWKKPREESLVAELRYMLEEILFLKALWKHQRRLWWWSFPFHVGLYLLGAAVGLAGLGGLMRVAGVAGPGWGVLTGGLRWLAAVAYALGTVGTIGLLVNRLARADLRAMLTPVATFNLLLLLALFVTGGGAVLSVADFPARCVALAHALLTASAPSSPPPALAAHLVLALAFLAYLPFSQMMHFVAKYFTYHQVRWDDRPLEPGGSIEREVQKLLEQPVAWGAPHVGADGRKNWIDIATEERT